MADDGVIDFAALLKEARSKSRNKLRANRKQKQGVQQTNSTPTKITTTKDDEEKEEWKINKNDINGNHTEASTVGNRMPISSISELLYPKLLQDHCLNTKIRDQDDAKTSKNENFAPKCPDHVYYIPKILGKDFSQSLLTWLLSLPYTQTNINSPDPSHYDGKWTRLKHAQRDVAIFDLQPQTSTNNANLLKNLCQLLIQIKAFPESHPPNHVLINKYQPHEGIMPHTDGPIYLNRTATFSIGGGDVLFKLTKQPKSNHHSGQVDNDEDDLVMEVKLGGDGSLIVFTDDAYTHHRHSIADRGLEELKVRQERESCANINCDGSVLVERTSKKCVNTEKGVGQIVKRGFRISLTFRHKYV